MPPRFITIPKLSRPVGGTGEDSIWMQLKCRKLSDDSFQTTSTTSSSDSDMFKETNKQDQHQQHQHHQQTNNDLLVESRSPIDETLLGHRRPSSRTPPANSSHNNINIKNTTELPSTLMNGAVFNSSVSTIGSAHTKTSSHDEDYQTRKLLALQTKDLHERNYLNHLLSNLIKEHGHFHRSVADALMMLGSANLRCENHLCAIRNFQSAARVFQQIYHSAEHPSVAKALNKLGMALCGEGSQDNLAERALTTALQIRTRHLGRYHIDTIDTLNNLAGLYWAQPDRHREALEAFSEVLAFRTAIFGQSHPSVAVTAHAMGVVHMELWNLRMAQEYFHKCLTIYQEINLPQDNPSMRKLQSDMASLEGIIETAKQL